MVSTLPGVRPRLAAGPGLEVAGCPLAAGGTLCHTRKACRVSSQRPDRSRIHFRKPNGKGENAPMEKSDLSSRRALESGRGVDSHLYSRSVCLISGDNDHQAIDTSLTAPLEQDSKTWVFLRRSPLFRGVPACAKRKAVGAPGTRRQHPPGLRKLQCLLLLQTECPVPPMHDVLPCTTS